MKHPNARLSAGIVAISLAAQSVVFAQSATTAATPSTATPSAAAQPMATQSAANGGASSTGSGTSDVSATAGATAGATANGTPVGTPMDAATIAASSTAAVSTSGVTTSGLADVRNADDAQAPLLTLADVLTLALQNNPTLTSAQAAVRAAQARVGTARSAGGVQVGLSGDISGNRAFGTPSGTAFSSGTGTGGTGTGGTGTGGTGTGGTGTGGTGSTGGISTTGGNQIFGLNTTESAGVSATLPIYTGGRVKASTRVARTGVDIQAANAQQTEQDLLLNTTTSYLNILRSGQLLQVANSNVDISREQLRVAQVRFNAGAAARLEVFQAEATLADSQQRRTAASATLGQSKATLNTLIGRVPETPVRVEPITALNLSLPQITTAASGAATSGATITSSSISTTPATESAAGGSSTSATSSSATSTTPGASAIETETVVAAASATPAGSDTLSSAELRAQALALRPLLAASQAQIANSQANVDLARAQRKPNIGVTLGSFLRNPVTFAGRFALSLGLGLSQTLFDSGRSRSQINEAQALLDQSRSGLAGQELNVGNQIEQSLLSLDSAQARTVSADTAVTSAQEALRAAQVAYQAGVRTSLEVSTAQTALLNAQTNAVNARFDVATGQAQLASAVGVLTIQAQTAATRNTQAQVDAAAAQAQAQADDAKPKKKRKKFLGIF